MRHAVKHRPSERSSVSMFCRRLMEIASSIPRQEPLRNNRIWLFSRCARSQPRALCFAPGDVKKSSCTCGLAACESTWVCDCWMARQNRVEVLRGELRSGRAQSYPAIRFKKPHEKAIGGTWRDIQKTGDRSSLHSDLSTGYGF